MARPLLLAGRDNHGPYHRDISIELAVKEMRRAMPARIGRATAAMAVASRPYSPTMLVVLFVDLNGCEPDRSKLWYCV